MKIKIKERLVKMSSKTCLNKCLNKKAQVIDRNEAASDL